MKTLIVIFIKLVTKILMRFGRGSALPGRIALMLDKNILKKLAKGYKVIIVTGTNGKTTTAGLIYSILRYNNKRVINNSTGANMKTGIVTCFINEHQYFDNDTDKYAVLEVDEAYSAAVALDVNPIILAVTNIFRDQLDRYGDIEHTRKLILNAVRQSPNATIILNADDPMEACFGAANTLYYGLEVEQSGEKTKSFCVLCAKELSNKAIYDHLGDWKCEGCGLSRPTADFCAKVLELSANSTTFMHNDEKIQLGITGLYNVYNALCAVAVVKTAANITEVCPGLESFSARFGRQERVNINGKNITLILVKNPAGCNQAIDMIATQPGADVCVLLNDDTGDGTDVSWIWDCNFEKLRGAKNFLVGGRRMYDLAIRLKTVGFYDVKCATFEEIVHTLGDNSFCLFTYTAMLEFRRFLAINH